MSLEVEAKLSCGDGFVPEALLERLRGVAVVEGPEVFEQEDRYYDTRTRSLAGAGLSARCRTKGSRKRIDVKPVPILSDVVVEREEISCDVEAKQKPGEAVRKLVERVLPIRLRGVPVEQIVVRTTRRRFVVSTDACAAELCLDEVLVRPSGKRRGVEFREVELELVAGERGAFDELARCIAGHPDLTASSGSKYERGLELLGMRGYGYGRERPELDLGMTTDDAARRVCGALLATIKDHEPGTRVGLDPEQLHKMRVATRRLRSAMALFGECFDGRNGEFLRRNLKWLGDVLGAVRDLDVFAADVEARRACAPAGGHEREGWTRLGEIVAVRRRAERRDLLEALGTTRYGRLLERAHEEFAREPRRRGGHVGRRPVGETAAESLAARVGKLGKQLERCRRGGRAEDAHRLRITGKKLRYAGEFFHSFLDEAANGRVERLSDLQDELGRSQDRWVQGQFARALAAKAVGEDEPSSLLHVLGQLVGACEQESAGSVERVGILVARLGADALIKGLERDARRVAKRTRKTLRKVSRRGGDGRRRLNGSK